LHDGITILPQGASTDTAAAEQDNCNSRDEERVIALFGLVHSGGHLVIHNPFSYFEMI
jgi:hypothetical protein